MLPPSTSVLTPYLHILPENLKMYEININLIATRKRSENDWELKNKFDSVLNQWSELVS